MMSCAALDDCVLGFARFAITPFAVAVVRGYRTPRAIFAHTLTDVWPERIGSCNNYWLFSRSDDGAMRWGDVLQRAC
jgi:hypothetical protein